MRSSSSVQKEGLHVRCPEVETRTSVVVEGSSLSTDNLGDGLNKCVVESGTHQDGLREGSCRVELASGIECDTRRRGNTVEGFLPPLVNRQAESRNTGTVVSSKVQLLGDGEGSDQSSSSCNRV